MSRTFRLAAEERRELLSIMRRHKEDGLVVRRANALILLDDGKSSVAIADFLYLDTGTVRSWRRSFETDGLSSLAIAGYSKREGHLSFVQEAELCAHLTAHPMRTSDEIRAYIEQIYGQKFSKPGAIKLMARLGFVWKKPKLLPLQASPEAQAEFITDYEVLCTELPSDEAIVFADAVHPEHQSRPAYGWFPKEYQPVIPANSGRRRMNIHAALNLETFQFQHVEALKINADSTLRLLKKIETAYPDKRYIHVFLDNARYHHARALKPWLADKNRRIKLRFLPAYAPHLNPIERLWGVIHKHVTHNKHYTKFNDFAAAILHFFQKTLPDKWPQFRDTITDNFRIITPEKHMLIQ
ncbi:MAG: IS630 family transposase [Robiginitomaculum sp.]|nr:IS630 family transposase [Robiginitomaculum sp.]